MVLTNWICLYQVMKISNCHIEKNNEKKKMIHEKYEKDNEKYNEKYNEKDKKTKI